MSRALIALTLFAALLPQLARADAVAIDTCADGWTWVRQGHGGACEPAPCGPACGGDCVEVARCFETTQVDQGDVSPDEPRQTYERPLPTLCDANGACAGTAHCVHSRECGPSHGACSVSFTRASAPLWAGVVLAWIALRATRRRRG